MEKVSGNVENINTQKRDGLKISGNWYNANEQTKPMVAKVEKGDNVELQVEGKTIKEVKILPKTDSAPAPAAKGKPFKTKDEIIKDMDDLLKHSTKVASEIPGWPEDAKKSFAVTHFIATKEALQKRGHL